MEKNVTSPTELAPRSERLDALATAAPVEIGVGSKYWLELKQLLPGSARSLWLFVNGAWRHLDDPNDGIQDSVQEAFCQCPERLEVAVWYQASVIVGLVVRSK